MTYALRFVTTSVLTFPLEVHQTDGSDQGRVGNKATSWMPAPEDMATSESLSEAQTAIQQNAQQIALRATKTEVSQMASRTLRLLAAPTSQTCTNATTNPDVTGGQRRPRGSHSSKMAGVRCYKDNTAERLRPTSRDGVRPQARQSCKQGVYVLTGSEQRQCGQWHDRHGTSSR
jgi:hypothetical protein